MATGNRRKTSSRKTGKTKKERMAEMEKAEAFRVEIILWIIVAIAEMVASLSKPTVSLVLGGSHSIGVPLAVSTDYSLIVPSGTMVIHPVRMSGTIIGAKQTYDYFRQMQDRIVGFIARHSRVSMERVEEMMMNTQMMTKDLGTILVGEQAVQEGIIDAVGGISDAFQALYQRIEERKH